MITLEDKLNSLGIEFCQTVININTETLEILGIDWKGTPSDILPLHLIEDEKKFLQIHFDRILCEQIYNGLNPVNRIAEIMNITSRQKLNLEDYIENQMIDGDLQESLFRTPAKRNWISVEAFEINSEVYYIPQRPFSFFENDKVRTVTTNEDKADLKKLHYSLLNNILGYMTNNLPSFPVSIFTKVIEQLPDVFLLDRRYNRVNQASQYLVQLDHIKDPFVLVVVDDRLVLKRNTFAGTSDVLATKHGESYVEYNLKAYDSKRLALACIYDIHTQNIVATKELLEKHLKLQKEVLDEINEIEKQEKVYFKGVLLG